MKNKINKIINCLILLYVFLLPWQTVYIFDEKFINGAKSQFLTGQIYGTEILLGLIAVIWLAVNFRIHKISNLTKNFKLSETKSLFIVSLWLFLAYCGLSVLWSSDRSAGFYLWLHLLEGAGLMLIILTVNINRLSLLWALLLSAGVQGLLATQQFLTQNISANKWLGIAGHSAGVLGDIVIETSDGRWLRAYGAFNHPNILAGFLVLGLISGLLLWLDDQKSRLKLLTILISCLIITAGLFFTFSRSAWLSLIIILPFFIYRGLKKILHQNQERKRFVTLIFGIILTLATLAYIFSPLVTIRANLSNRLEAISTNDRLSQMVIAGNIISNHWLLGIGLNNYTTKLAQLNPDALAYDLQPVHNVYLLIFVELGIVGLGLLIILFYYAIKSNQKISEKILFMAPLGVILIISFFDHYFWTQYVSLMLFWLGLTIFLKHDNLDYS